MALPRISYMYGKAYGECASVAKRNRDAVGETQMLILVCMARLVYVNLRKGGQQPGMACKTHQQELESISTFTHTCKMIHKHTHTHTCVHV